MKKILALLLSSTTGLIIVAIIILVPILMIMDFFGANITDGYVEDNMEYAEQYRDFDLTSWAVIKSERPTESQVQDNSKTIEVEWNDKKRQKR